MRCGSMFSSSRNGQKDRFRIDLAPSREWSPHAAGQGRRFSAHVYRVAAALCITSGSGRAFLEDEMSFEIRYGLGGGFGGAGDWCPTQAETLESANDEAYELAKEEYDGYAGSHGLRTVAQIMKEEGLDEEEAEEEYNEERDGWLDYKAREVTP